MVSFVNTQKMFTLEGKEKHPTAMMPSITINDEGAGHGFNSMDPQFDSSSKI